MLNVIFVNINKKMKTTKELKNYIDTNIGKVVIIPHISPDGDAIGACTALSQILDKKGIENYIITCDRTPEYLKFLKKSDSIISYQTDKEKCTEIINSANTIFMLDHNDFSREGNLEEITKVSTAKKIMIDHHLEPSDVDYVLSDTSFSSTCELLYVFISEIWEKEIIDKDIANSLYTGINTDTGGFSYNSSTPRLFKIVADLLEQGLEKDFITESIYQNNKLSRLRLMGNIFLKRLEINDKYPIAIMPISREELLRFEYKDGDLEGIVNTPLSIKEILVSVQITQKKERIKLSFRSKGDVPVNEWAKKYFNGGGHKNAAGGQIENKSLYEVVKLVKETMEWFTTNYIKK